MRVLDVKGGMVNAVGLANMGVERFVASKHDAINALPTTVLGSIAGFCVDDYVESRPPSKRSKDCRSWR